MLWQRDSNSFLLILHALIYLALGLTLKIHPFLGASPDGLLGKKGVIEVKRVHPYEAENLEQALLWQHIIKEIDGSLQLNPNHQYYHQVQLQIFCTGRTWAHFVASDGKNIIIKTVLSNKEFIDAILPKRKNFYYNILLLELAYPRVKDGIDRIGKLGFSYSMLCNLRNNWWDSNCIVTNK